MARTNPALVINVLGNDYEGGDLAPYIRAGEIICDQLVAAVAADTTILTTIADATLADITTWLAAWAYCQSHQQAKSASNLGASASFRGNDGKYLENNNYGQMALMLDPTGKLAEIQEGNPYECGWLGTPTGNQRDWYDRGNTRII